MTRESSGGSREYTGGTRVVDGDATVPRQPLSPVISGPISGVRIVATTPRATTVTRYGYVPPSGLGWFVQSNAIGYAPEDGQTRWRERIAA